MTMGIKLRKKCPYCRHWFIANPRLKERQIACFNKECQKKRQRILWYKWRRENSDYFKNHYKTYMKDWFKSHPKYLKKYRQNKKLLFTKQQKLG